MIAAYAGQPDRYSYPVEVTARPTERNPYNGEPTPIPGTVQAEDFDEGGEGLTYHDTTPDNTPGAYRANVNVDIEARDDGGFQITDIAADEWLEYTVDVAEAGTYEVTVFVSATAGRGSFQVSIGDQSSEVLRAVSTGDPQTVAPIATMMDLEAGEQILRLDFLRPRSYYVDRIEARLTGSTSSESPAGLAAFRLFPNPVADVLAVETGRAGTVEIFNALGQQVRRVEVPSGTRQIPVGDLASGTYLVRWTADGQVAASGRFVKR